MTHVSSNFFKATGSGTLTVGSTTSEVGKVFPSVFTGIVVVSGSLTLGSLATADAVSVRGKVKTFYDSKALV